MIPKSIFPLQNYAGRFFRSVSLLALIAGASRVCAQTLDSFRGDSNGFITSAAVEPDGKLFVGGQFTAIAGTGRSRFARLRTDGTVDPSPVVGVTSGTQVTAIASHPDGSRYVGGNFTQFGGEMHGYLVRVLANGTVDTAFTTHANGAVAALAVQEDEKVVVGGSFTIMAGQPRTRLARLNADGTLDGAFAASANDEVVSILVQADGAIVIAGRFTEVNGTPRNRLARLTSTGALDAAFNPNANDVVEGMAMQTDGRILAFGNFTTMGGVARNQFARLQAGGSVDLSFVLPAASAVTSMVAQADGQVLVAGTFNDASVTGTAVIRVNTDGSLDPDFTPAVANQEAHLVLDAAGHIFAAGPFTTFMGQSRRYLARVTNPTPATQTLEVGALGQLVWTLGGSTPVVSVVHFEASVDGTIWTPLGHGHFADGAWTLPSPGLPVGTTQLRAHGLVPANGSDSCAIATVAVLPALPGAPAITANPAGQAVLAGTDLTLRVAAAGNGSLAYQWERDGGAVAGATSSTLFLPSAQLASAGTYTVVVSNAAGAVESIGATVTVTVPPASAARVLNLSTRALAGTDASVMIPGFVINGTGTKRVLIRAVGPTLAQDPYHVAGVLPDPQMTLKRWNPALPPNGAYEDVTNNDEWMANSNAAEITSTSASVGAFALADNHEAALLVDLAAGQYSVVAGGVNGGTGIAIVEVYDADDSAVPARLINVSNRGFAGSGDEVMIPGFVISAEGPKTVLLRVVGPTLAADFGVPGTMGDPRLTLYRQDGNAQTELLTQDNWSEHPQAATTAQVAQQVQAFPLGAGSADAAVVVTLNPGVYSVVGSSAIAGGTGVVLVEMYVVP